MYRPLTCTADATAYQRDWAKTLRQRMAAGEKFAFANADTPHELFHAANMPVVANQWWSAVIAAKQLSGHYLDRMGAMGFHRHLARYSSLPLIAQLDGDVAVQPWGGLPKPAILCARQSADDHQRIFSLWAEATGAPLFMFSAAGIPDPAPDWWQRQRHDWETFNGSARLDLMVAEMRDLIELIETLTDRPFDWTALADLMKAIHAQESAFEETSEALAAADRSPVRIAEQIPNVMIPQWHRGSAWAVAHAERFRDEVFDRTEKGVAICDRENIRMMWIGAGLWFDTDFYTAFEESHGAVFAWSMYLPFAADGYMREDKGDPLRTLASRFATMNEQLHQPPWANEWLAHQARKYRIDVAVMLVPQRDRPSGYGSLFAKHALQQAGVHVIEIWADMVDQRDWDRRATYERIARELDRLSRSRPA